VFLEELPSCVSFLFLPFPSFPPLFSPCVLPFLNAECFFVTSGDNEGGVNLAYARRVNTEFQKIGARGTSILFSSGDGGVSGSQPTNCNQFIPTFPAASPYVTAVGGSSLGMGSGETAAGLSAGGFSDYWSRPKYQEEAVAAYFSTAPSSALPSKEHYNQTGAGFPDVAALATNFNIVWGGSSIPVDGTSCASPTFSGILSLVNDARLAAGKTSLGYLNTMLYASKGAWLNDITSGSNPGCGTNGFPAVKGWDPVTGWGTPNFPKMMKALVTDMP
jgi:tripeptidyl-peptidase I